MYIAPKGKTHNLMLSETGFCANIFATKTVVELIPIFTSGDYTTNATATNLRKYQWDYIHNPENIVGIFEDDSEGASGLPLTEAKHLFLNKLYSDILRDAFNIYDIWDETGKTAMLNEVRLKIKKVFYITNNENGSAVWDYKRFFSELGVNVDNVSALDLYNRYKDDERYIHNYSMANYVIKQVSDLFLKESGTYDVSFDEFVKLFYNKKKAELGTLSYTWIDGRTSEMMDPRNYYKNDAYDFTKLENDVKELVLFKEEEYINPVSEEVDAAKIMRLNIILSMYGEYMYLKGCSEVPGITDDGANVIKSFFYNYWEEKETEQWGFYWKWNTLNQERLAQERQRYLALLQGQQALEAYIQMLEDGKFQAILEIAGGGLSVGGTVAVFVFFPPANAGGWVLGSASIGFGSDQIAGGINKLNAIKTGMFDPSKEYKPVKGIIMGMAGEYGSQVGFAYDLTSILVGFLSARGEYKTITELPSLAGNELEAIIRGYSTGAETINTSMGTYYLVKK